MVWPAVAIVVAANSCDEGKIVRERGRGAGDLGERGKMKVKHLKQACLFYF
jgi:hypothetical protein